MEDRKDTPIRMKVRIKWPEYHLHVWLGVIQIYKASVLKGKRKKQPTNQQNFALLRLFTSVSKIRKSFYYFVTVIYFARVS